MITVSGRSASRAQKKHGGSGLIGTNQVAEMRRTVLFWLSAALLVAVFLAPLMWILASSFKSQAHIFADSSELSLRSFFPTSLSFENYKETFTVNHIGRALTNSLIVAALQVVLTVLVAVPAAYALTRLKFRMQGFIFGLILVTFMVPAEAVVIPLFQIVSSLNIADTLLSVFLPFVASPFALFLLMQAFRDIPGELDEAAWIDGAGHWTIMTRILLPNIGPSMATVALMTFMFSWNSFLWPLIAIQSDENRLVQVAIAVNTVPGELPNWGQVFAGSIIASIPILILFLFVQRYFIRGMVTSGIK